MTKTLLFSFILPSIQGEVTRCQQGGSGSMQMSTPERPNSHMNYHVFTPWIPVQSAPMWLIWKHLSGQTIHSQCALALPGSHRPPVSCHQNTEPSGPCQWPSKRECQLPGSLECPAIGGRTCTLCPGDHQTHLQVLDVTSDKSRFIEQTQQVFFFPSEMK